MSPRVILLFLSLIFLYLSNTSHSIPFPPFREPKVEAFLHPIRKDEATNSYYTPISTGAYSDFSSSLKLLIDLNGAAPLLRPCAKATNSTTYHSIKCGSTRCNYTNPNSSCPNNTTCRKYVSTSFSDKPVNVNLLRDTIDLLYTPNGVYHMDSEKTTTLTLTCTDDATALKSIPSAFHGAIGLANTHFSIPSQLALIYKFPLKISLCLPSTEKSKIFSGNLWIGGGPFYYFPYHKDVSTIFSSTPLIGNKKSGEYIIHVTSIKIGGKIIPLLSGATKICTLAPYTVLHSSIYKALVATFTVEAKMVKAPAVKPFDVCFRSNGGRGTPVIELVMSGGAKWKIYGSNSLVKVNKDVDCLGFVDGGMNPKNLIVIGGYQLEDNLVQFDLQASKFSFSSSLLPHNTSCSIDRFFGM